MIWPFSWSISNFFSFLPFYYSGFPCRIKWKSKIFPPAHWWPRNRLWKRRASAQWNLFFSVFFSKKIIVVGCWLDRPCYNDGVFPVMAKKGICSQMLQMKKSVLPAACPVPGLFRRFRGTGEWAWIHKIRKWNAPACASIVRPAGRRLYQRRLCPVWEEMDYAMDEKTISTARRGTGVSCS